MSRPTAGPDFGVARAHRGIGIGDFDGDGRLDLVVTVLGDRAQLLRNVSSPDNHWVTLRLQGQKSARDGAGARVKLGAQSDAMTTAVGYASSSDFGVHFGLADCAIDRIEVRWPSGATQALEIKEGESDSHCRAKRSEAGTACDAWSVGADYRVTPKAPFRTAECERQRQQQIHT